MPRAWEETILNSQLWSEGLCPKPQGERGRVEQEVGPDLDQAGPAVDGDAIDCLVSRTTLFM